jgi:alpha,alpha-trehalose phosphorylase
VRLVSLVQRAVAAIRYEVTPLDEPARVVVQSELVANEPGPMRDDGDPRAQKALGEPLVSEEARALEHRLLLCHRTRQSGLRVAAACDHEIDCPANVAVEVTAYNDVARLTTAVDLQPDERLTLVKYLGYGWSRPRSRAALVDQVAGAVSEARHTGWDGLVASQRAFLDDFWERADVEIEGDDELQLAARVGQFHVMQSAARAEGRAIPAKGLTGSGYDGHAFWDSESYVLPVLSYAMPSAAADALRWRHATLGLARDRAHQLGLRGAAFPWRTIHGEECSGYWPAGTAAFHVNADIADAVIRLERVAPDDAFQRDVGIELLVHTARLWCSLGHRDDGGGFHVHGVTGPDEYSALGNDNTYTNLMAARNLRAAARAAQRWPDRASELDVDAEEIADWQSAADAVVVPYDDDLRVTEQDQGFSANARWDFAGTTPEQYPLLLHFPYFDLYRKQVVKQADLVMALFKCGDHFSLEQKRRDFDYYEPLTVRDSSLSACIQSVVAAEVGYLDLAFAYLREAALLDLEDLEHNTADGLHIATLAGTWIGFVSGLGGMREHDGRLGFAPRLAGPLRRLAFRVQFRGRRLRVEVSGTEARYVLVEGEPLEIEHYGETVALAVEEPATRPIAAVQAAEPPRQPPGREPQRGDPLE